MASSQLLSADLSSPAHGALRGFLLNADEETGISGWVVDLSDPGRALSVELCAGGAAVAATRADLRCEDPRVAAAGWRHGGFNFPPAEVRALVSAGDVAADARLWIRVSGTEFSLASSKPVPSPAEFLGSADPSADRDGGADLASAQPPASVPHHVGSQVPVAAMRDLPAALHAMSARARDLLRLPLAPGSAATVGYVECLSWSDAGYLWVFGWMRGGLLLHAPAVVVVGGEKHTAGIAFATYERGDLPENSFGIVGLLGTDWRPGDRGDLPTPLLFIGHAADACLPFAENLKILTSGDCAGRLESLRPRLGGPFAGPLLRTFGSVSNWSLDSGRVSGVNVKASADKVVVVPGFGCLAKGWALSPLSAVEGFLLRVGRAVVAADPRSISRKPRPDLRSVAPDGHAMTETGGFVAAFPGYVDERDSGETVLKVVCEGGVSTNHKVSADSVRVLGISARLDELLDLFPAIREEPFFPELALRISEGTRRRISWPVAFDARTAERPLVVAVPDDRRDTALLFSELALTAARRGGLPPVVALARPGVHRADVLSLIGDVQRNIAEASSLFFVPDPAYAVYALDEVLARTAAARFAYVGPGVFPTEAGWDALLDRLEGSDGELAFLPVDGSADGPAPDAAPPRPECFAWRRRAFAEWLAQAPLFLSGSTGRTLTLPAGALPVSRDAVARRGSRAPASMLATWVNERLPVRLAEASHA